MNYSKQPLDYPQILQMLKDRGLIVRDEIEALRQLKIISYFRLSNYMRPMEADKTTHIFKPGSFFENAVDLWMIILHNFQGDALRVSQIIATFA